MGQFAIIGWGSLIWDPKELWTFGIESTRWHPDGPALSLEFSSISITRRGALILVIDARGSVCPTYWVSLENRHWEAVYDILKRRERQLDIVDRYTGPQNGVQQTVREWMKRHPAIERAVWTAQVSNFSERTGRQFSVANAIDYASELQRTRPDGFAQAQRYMYRAPAQTQTPIRHAFEAKWPPPRPTTG